jgi:hypothetical protein
MDQSDGERYKAALEEILRVGTTPDTMAIGTLPGGAIGPLWSVGGQEKAFAKILQIATDALDGETA